MKNWINRLLTGADDSASSARAADTPVADVDAASSAGGDVAARIDAAYFAWLSAAAGAGQAMADRDAAERLIEEVRSLTRQPTAAAELVPRVPEVVPRLLASLRDEGASTTELARQAAEDVVLVAEVIREANSAYYRPIQPVKNLEAAIMMLGQNGLRMLLARIAFRPVINMGMEGGTRRVAPRIWDQSVKCALAASLMAPGLSAGVFEAYLAGLMQNVGLVVAFRLADRMGAGAMAGTNGDADADGFGARLMAASRQLSAAIALHWDFPPDVANAIAGADVPDGSHLAQALAQGDRIAKLRMLIDAGVLPDDDVLVAQGLDNFQRRCLGKLSNLET